MILEHELISLNLALKIVSALGALCAFLVWRRKRLAMNEANKSSGVDPSDHEVEESQIKGSTNIKKIEVNVQLINGECHVDSGDKYLNAKCNAALAELDGFQREFLSSAPDGEPNKMVFTEEIEVDSEGRCVQRKAYFHPHKPEKEKSRVKQLLEFLQNYPSSSKKH